MLVEKLLIYGGYLLCSVFILFLICFKGKKERIPFILYILSGILIVVIGNHMLDTKKDYITKIKVLIEANTPEEKERKNEFIKELEKENILTLDFIYKDLLYKELKKLEINSILIGNIEY